MQALRLEGLGTVGPWLVWAAGRSRECCFQMSPALLCGVRGQVALCRRQRGFRKGMKAAKLDGKG